MMKKSLALAALVAALAAARLNADDSCREVRIRFDGEQAKHVTFYEAPDESGRVLFSNEDGKVRLEWLGKTEKSKAVFSAPLFKGILADMRKDSLAPVEFTVGIRYEGTDLPKK